jgi:hypothetical protein
MTQQLGCAYFTCPRTVISREYFDFLRRSDLVLYLTFLSESERRSTPTFRISDKRIQEITGLSQRSIQNSRRVLLQQGLILPEREMHGGYRYTLLNPQTCEKFSREEVEKFAPAAARNRKNPARVSASALAKTSSSS